MLSVYDRRQTCDHTNKIIQRSSKGKPCAKQRILRRREFREATVYSPLTGFSVDQQKWQGSLDPGLWDGLLLVSRRKSSKPLGSRVTFFQATL